jgi:hypothetical protein
MPTGKSPISPIHITSKSPSAPPIASDNSFTPPKAPAHASSVQALLYSAEQRRKHVVTFPLDAGTCNVHPLLPWMFMDHHLGTLVTQHPFQNSMNRVKQ